MRASLAALAAMTTFGTGSLVAPPRVLAQTAAAAAGPAFVTEGDWSASMVPGLNDGSSFWTNQTGTTATWKPMFGGPVRARVAFYRVVYVPKEAGAPANNDPSLSLSVVHGGKAENRTLDGAAGSSGWVDLGEWEWRGGPNEYVRLTRTSKGGGATRIAAVRFDVLGEDGKSVISSITLNDVTGGPLATKPPLPVPMWTDITDPEERRAVVALQDAGAVEGVSATEFRPRQTATRKEMARWLVYAAGIRPIKTVTLADARAMGLPFGETDGPLTAGEAAGALKVARKALAGETRPSPPVPSPLLLPGSGTLTRGELAVAINAWRQANVVPGPPPQDAGGPWKLTFHDEFDGPAVDTKVWQIESGAPTHILSSRWPENVTESGGLLHLLTRKQSRGGREWTTGNLWTRAFRQQYGYFECRMRAGAATGLNNAFWLMDDGKPSDAVHAEIDITETHYPRTNAVTLHNWAGTHTATGKGIVEPHDLSDDFHVYAALWTPDSVTWYFDGQPIRTVPALFCHRPMIVRVSTAVGRFAGRITDALDGTHMDVDWVRVWTTPALEKAAATASAALRSLATIPDIKKTTSPFSEGQP